VIIVWFHRSEDRLTLLLSLKTKQSGDDGRKIGFKGLKIINFYLFAAFEPKLIEHFANLVSQVKFENPPNRSKNSNYLEKSKPTNKKAVPVARKS